MSYVDALQATLAAEHAALYVYAYLGAQTSSSSQPRLYATIGEAYTAHLDRRDQLTARIAGLGATPVGAEPAYQLPHLDSPAEPSQVERRALGVEQGCATTYLTLVGHAPSSDRAWAVGLLTDAAVRELSFDGDPQTFPGR